ncbi:iron-containing redox enzyme family protein [Alcaligenaceae bacterium]|nr:iron-containing redox enzyme family protein [Alcaligenaceae bacterium]
MDSAKIRSVVCKDESPSQHDARELYFDLLNAKPEQTTLAQSRRFLSRQLTSVTGVPADLPADVNDLAHWMSANTAAVGKQYRQYLDERQNGGARRYFPGKGHALYFLNAVAPTKLVDGAWLYGVTSQWRDSRYSELIRIYLEELGDGEPEQNHVVMYKKLLAVHDCQQWEALDEPYFMQGAIQLSLAQHAREYLPEVIGFNLGYEQLPLHLLICAYELNELGIDPYYFTLHVTIDNAASGHAARAVKSVTDAMPVAGGQDEFYQRIRNGYQLNSLGLGTNEIIAGFDLKQEMLGILAAKASVGAALHSDYCRVAGKTVTQWLSSPGQIPDFVGALERIGWIRRHTHPENSRFWNLIVGEKAPMFGVFNAYEKQVIHDWIAGESLPESLRGNSRVVPRRIQPCSSRLRADRSGGDFDADALMLKERLASVVDPNIVMDLLVPWLSPTRHHTAVGLMATRMFSKRMGA